MTTIFLENQSIHVENIYCIGRNYNEHIAELNHKRDEEPLVFLKPNSSILLENNGIVLPKFSDNIHYECEVVVLIGKDGINIPEQNALEYISGYAIGLDLTARDLQNKIIDKGLPWLKSKGFTHSACLSHFIPAKHIEDFKNIKFSLSVNKEIKQQGNTKDMIYDIPFLISYLSNIYSLKKGDLIYTGTPKGVGPLYSQDILELNLNELIYSKFTVI